MILSPVPTNSPEYSTLYGPGKQILWTLSNSRIGAGARYSVSFRFRAHVTGRVNAVRMYFQEGAPGYHGGNGGTIRLQIVRDDGGGRPSARQVIASADYRPGSAPNGTRSLFPRVAFPPNSGIVAGEVYHLLQTNVDADPSGNYISSNNCQVWKGHGHPCRWDSPDDWATLFRQGSGAWQDFTKDGDAVKYWAPILEVETSGGTFGNTTMEGGSVEVRPSGSRASPTLYRGTARLYEAFNPSRTITVRGFSVRYCTYQDNTTVRWSLGTASGVLWTPYADHYTTRVNPNQIASGAWRDVLLDSHVTFRQGQAFELSFQADKDIGVSCCRTGNSYGFTAWRDSVGYIQDSAAPGRRWNHNRHSGTGSDSSWPVMLHLTP